MDNLSTIISYQPRNCQIYQIYYDEPTKEKLLPNFIPLDNTENKRPDWYEFWIILNFLKTNQLEDDVWYGFFSPKFYEKVGVHSQEVLQIVSNLPNNFNVANFSAAWDQACYFKNPWEQGEFWHPGITKASQAVFDFIGIDFNIESQVTSPAQTVFSNFIVAKKEYWRQWRNLAEIFFDMTEFNESFSEIFQFNTSYGNSYNRYPIKTFIQERFPSLLLTAHTFKVYHHDRSANSPMFDRLFLDSDTNRSALKICGKLKERYQIYRDPELIDAFLDARSVIALNPQIAHERTSQLSRS